MKRHYIALALLVLTACTKNAPNPGPLDASGTGKLARYNLGVGDYDPRPVTTFVLSYDSADRVTDVFEKAGQTQISYNLSYNGTQLATSSDNNLGVQTYTFDASGRITHIDYTTPLTVGKRVYTYDGAGKLLSVLDSVTNPPSFPIQSLYVLTYDAAGANVTEIDQSSLDLSGRPTLRQVSTYIFDDKPNPFQGFPPLLDVHQLPGDIAATVNRNNVLYTRIDGTVPVTSTGGSVPTLDTLVNYASTRVYTYNAKGYPSSCTESFQDIQYNYTGSRNFSYDY